VASGYLFSADSNANGKFQSGVIFKDFKITTTTSPASSSGIKVHRTANSKFENLQITGLTGDGIDIPASAGDPDASFIVVLDRVRMDTIAGWCGNFNAPSGGYFGSNLRIVNSSFNGCGTASSSVPPTSGGIQFKGLIAQLENSAFTINNNVDFFVQGLDTSLQITIDGTDFENNISTVLPHVYVEGGLRGFHMLNSECLNNDSNVGQGCVWFNSTGAVIGNVTLDKVQVRATTANNTYTAFKITGPNAIIDTMRATNMYWQTFDLSGQTRFSGFKFTGITGQAQFSISATNTAQLIPVGTGATMPMKLAATGEWIEYHVPSAGITKTGIGGGPALTLQNFYLFNSAATNTPIVGAIELSATVPTLDAEGYFVKTGDSTRTFIGTATTDGSGNFLTSSPQSSFYPGANGVITSASVNALSVGLNGVTNPVFNVDASTASQVAGLNVKGVATGGTVAISVTDSGANASLSINAKGTGGIGLDTTATGPVTVGPGGTVGGVTGKIVLNGSSGANGGASMQFQRNTVNLFQFGNSSGILGGASDDFVVYSNVSGAGTTPSMLVASATGAVTFPFNFGTTAPVTTTISRTMLSTDNSLIFNGAGSLTLTLQAAATYPGRWLYVKTIAAQTVVSAASNVVPRAGGAAGTAILAAAAGNWAALQSDATNWVIMAGTP
jgi:hypothetical protein